MTEYTYNQFEFKELDLVAIERQARAMQAKAIADMFRALRRGIVSLFSRATAAHTA